MDNREPWREATTCTRLSYKLFGKKLLKTSRLVASAQVLTNSTIPTSDCDVVVTFPPDPDTNVLMWLLDKLRERTPDIIVHVRHHSNTKGPVLHLTASHESLLKYAEDLAIRKPLKDEYGGGMKEFTYDDHEFFCGVDDEDFFSSQERQSILYYMLNNLRAFKGETLGTIKFLEGQAIVPLLESRQIISQVFPLHSMDDLTDLRESWMQRIYCRQPLDKICDYFGVKIAMYFAYLGHYTLALVVPAIIGLLIWFIQGDEEGSDDRDLVFFAIFNAFWATIYLEHWKRRSSELAYEWGTLDSKNELMEDPRPLFTGDLKESPVTGRLEPYYPQWKRNLFRYFVTLPVVLFCLCVVFVVMLLIFQLQEWINIKVDVANYPGFLTVLPKVLLAIIIGIFDEIYKKIALWLNEMENYRMAEVYENHLITKLALFQFVNSFLSLFYIAFYLQDMDRLRDQLAAILITRQILGNIKEALLPYLQWQARLYKVGYDLVSDLSPSDSSVKVENSSENCNSKEGTDDTVLRQRTVTSQESSTKGDNQPVKTKDRRYSIYVKRSLKLTQAEVESEMKKYEDTLEDHLEMLIQFGYVTLFSSAFPLAALCALVNNVIEIRSDAFKLCMHHQRPFGQRVEGIGTWQDALELMGILAVAVNCALIGVSGQICRLLPITEISTVIIIIVVLEHAMLAMKFIVAYAIPDVPEAIATKKARLEFLRREAWKRMESQSKGSNVSNDNIVNRQFSKKNIFAQKSDNVFAENPSSMSSVVHQIYKESTFGPGSSGPARPVSEGRIVKSHAQPSQQMTGKGPSEKAMSDRGPTETNRIHPEQIKTATNPYISTDGTKSDGIKTVPRSLNLNIKENSHNAVNRTKSDSTHLVSSGGEPGKNLTKGDNLHKSSSVYKPTTQHYYRSYSVDNDPVDKYIDRNSGTIKRDISLPEEKIKKLMTNSDRRHSGTYVSSMTIPLHTTTQRKTIFSVVKTGGSSHVIHPQQQQRGDPHSSERRGSTNSMPNRVDQFIKKESSL